MKTNLNSSNSDEDDDGRKVSEKSASTESDIGWYRHQHGAIKR